MQRRKLTKKELAKREAEYLAKQKAWDDLKTKYHGKTFTATVRWFDNMSGQGMVEIDEDLSLPIYACNIRGKKTWFPETACVYYKAKQIVEIEIDVHAYSAVFAKGITPGHFDSEGWDRIKNQDLAFRCNDAGEAINGLFSQGKNK